MPHLWCMNHFQENNWRMDLRKSDWLGTLMRTLETWPPLHRAARGRDGTKESFQKPDHLRLSSKVRKPLWAVLRAWAKAGVRRRNPERSLRGNSALKISPGQVLRAIFGKIDSWRVIKDLKKIFKFFLMWARACACVFPRWSLGDVGCCIRERACAGRLG